MKIKTEPQLTDVLDEFKKDIMKSVNCVNIGRIEAFDISNQTASISLQIKQVQETNDDGSIVISDYPVLLECPVFVLSGGDSYISMPITEGDTCLVLFNDRDIDNWFVDSSGNYPNTVRMHDISDAFALVGIKNLGNIIADYVADQITLKLNDNNKIEIKDGSIDIKTSLLTQDGDIETTGDVDAVNVTGSGQVEGATVKAGNGVSGTVTSASPTGSITFVNGIVTAFTP